MKRAYHYTNLMVLIFLYLGSMKLFDWDPVVHLHMRKLWAKFARVCPLTYLGLALKAETYRTCIGFCEIVCAYNIFYINHFGTYRKFRNFFIYGLILTSALWLYTEQMYGGNIDSKSTPFGLILMLLLLRFIGKLENAINRGHAQRQRRQEQRRQQQQQAQEQRHLQQAQEQVQRPAIGDGIGDIGRRYRQLAPAPVVHVPFPEGELRYRLFLRQRERERAAQQQQAQ